MYRHTSSTSLGNSAYEPFQPTPSAGGSGDAAAMNGGVSVAEVSGPLVNIVLGDENVGMLLCAAGSGLGYSSKEESDADPSV